MRPVVLAGERRLAVPGRGHAGALGGPAGDLYVTVDVADHPVLTRRGADLHVTVPVAVHEAGLGAVIEAPGLDGPVRLRVPAGVTSGSTAVLRGEGAFRHGTNERGDLVVTLQIVLPPVLDERSRDLLREFGRLNGDDVRRGLFDQR